LFADARAFGAVVGRLAEPFVGREVSHVVGVDALGFVLAGAVAVRLGAGFVAARKGGRSAWAVRSVTFRDYSDAEKTLEMGVDVLDAASRVLIVDDWAETGAQITAAATLCRMSGASVVGAAVLNADPAARQQLRGKVGELREVIGE
jgi:adenine phosphoribosyltransferase